LKWVVDRVKEHFHKDVSILAVYGSYVNRTEGPLSDVDFFFVPKTARGSGLAATFIVEGVGYDLFPMSWTRIEGIANFKEPLTPLLGDSVIAFSSSEEDEARFMALRKTLEKNLENNDFMHIKAMERFKKARELLGRMIPADGMGALRSSAGRILMHLADAVAYENCTYFHKGLKRMWHDLPGFSKLPVRFMELSDLLIESNGMDDLMGAASAIVRSCAAFLDVQGDVIVETPQVGPSSCSFVKADPIPEDAEPVDAIDYPELAGFYEEAKSAFNKIYSSCSGPGKDFRLAFISAVCLQKALDEDVHGMDFDLLSDFKSSDLSMLQEKARKSEQAILDVLEPHVKIKRYGSVDEFMASQD